MIMARCKITPAGTARAHSAQASRSALLAAGSVIIALTAGCASSDHEAEPTAATQSSTTIANQTMVETAVRKQIEATSSGDAQALRESECGYLADELNSSEAQVIDALTQARRDHGEIAIAGFSDTKIADRYAVTTANLGYSVTRSTRAIEFRLENQAGAWKVCSTNLPVYTD
ncbi:hypothetical protein ACIBCD_11590 [Nocardia brasiliensis]|uniref:Rv0361 family membrane protein n=1 Tax=Nocardia brasiliensis TaxID=37326 RepID=UPI00378772C7